MNSKYIALIVLLSMSCKTNSEKDYEISATALQPDKNKEVTIGNIIYEFAYRDGDEMEVAAKNNSNDHVNYKDQSYIIIKHFSKSEERTPILKVGINSFEAYQDRVAYYSYQAQKDLKMICNGDTLSAIGYNYENNMEMIPYNTMVFVFEKCKKDHFTLLFNDVPFENYFIKVKF